MGPSLLKGREVREVIWDGGDKYLLEKLNPYSLG